eukprot:1153343-Pelagomonas_calceolata.AAC.12
MGIPGISQALHNPHDMHFNTRWVPTFQAAHNAAHSAHQSSTYQVLSVALAKAAVPRPIRKKEVRVMVTALCAQRSIA